MPKKAILITGASRGIGAATARLLAQQGHRVALVARSAEALAHIAAAIQEAGGEALALAADVSDEASVQAAVNAATERFGRLDVLVNNAGIGIFKAVEELSSAEWDAVMGTNVKGSFLFSKAVIPGFKAQGQGHIISVASDVAKRPIARGGLYCASKYAQDALMACLRKEVRPFGIKVSCLYPGVVRTTFDGQGTEVEKKKDWLADEDVAAAIAYMINAPAHVVTDEWMMHPLGQDY